MFYNLEILTMNGLFRYLATMIKVVFSLSIKPIGQGRHKSHI